MLVKPEGPRRLARIGIVTTVLITLVALMSMLLPPAVDWHETFRPAILEILQGRSPYNVDGFYNPPWGLLPLIPLGWFPESVGRAILVILGLASYIYVAHRLGAKPFAVFFLLISPPVFHVIFNGNTDWIATLGFVLPPQIGLFFISTKPQIGIAVGLFWLVQSWQQGGLGQTVKTFGPFTIVFFVSLILFGPWPLRVFETGKITGSASLWPMSIPVGLALFVTAIRRKKIEYAMAASPCLSPYLLLHSWVGALLAIISSVPETIAAVIGLWILVAIRYFS